MKSISVHKIEFAGLKVGKHQFSFELNKEFFENFSFFDIYNSFLRFELPTFFLKMIIKRLRKEIPSQIFNNFKKSRYFVRKRYKMWTTDPLNITY